MSTPKVFVTGVTGYVGGDALYIIMARHPEWQYSFLVRDPKRIADFASKQKDVRIVQGDLGDTDLIKREAAAADIVMTFASSDDEPSAEAVRDGMSSDSRVRFWIHTSGTANLLFDDKNRNVSLGELNPKVWDDVDDIQAINEWPQSVLHRPVEKIVLDAGRDVRNIRSAVVCPPVIVGSGRGPGNRRTIQVPILIDLIRRRESAFRVGRGEARWSFIHVHDLSQLYLLISEAAASGGGSAVWGAEGYYFAGNGEVAWGKISERIAERLFEAGKLKSKAVETLQPKEAEKVFGRLGPEMVGGNSRSSSTRARKLLGWAPTFSDFMSSIDEQVAYELGATQSRLLDFKQGHMPKTPRRSDAKL